MSDIASWLGKLGRVADWVAVIGRANFEAVRPRSKFLFLNWVPIVNRCFAGVTPSQWSGIR